MGVSRLNVTKRPFRRFPLKAVATATVGCLAFLSLNLLAWKLNWRWLEILSPLGILTFGLVGAGAMLRAFLLTIIDLGVFKSPRPRFSNVLVPALATSFVAFWLFVWAAWRDFPWAQVALAFFFVSGLIGLFTLVGMMGERGRESEHTSSK